MPCSSTQNIRRLWPGVPEVYEPLSAAIALQTLKAKRIDECMHSDGMCNVPVDRPASQSSALTRRDRDTQSIPASREQQCERNKLTQNRHSTCAQVESFTLLDNTARTRRTQAKHDIRSDLLTVEARTCGSSSAWLARPQVVCVACAHGSRAIAPCRLVVTCSRPCRLCKAACKSAFSRCSTATCTGTPHALISP